MLATNRNSKEKLWIAGFLISIMLVAVILAYEADRKNYRAVSLLFNQTQELVVEDIKDGFASLSTVINSFSGFLLVSGDVSADKWNKYVDSLSVDERFGITYMGYYQLDAQKNYSSFDIYSLSEDLLDELFSESSANNELRLSRVFNYDGKQNILVALPVKNAGQGKRYVYVVLDIKKFLSPIISKYNDITLRVLPSSCSSSGLVDFTHDMSKNTEQSIPRFNTLKSQKNISIGNNNWVLEFATLPGFGAEINYLLPVIILVSGIGLFVVSFCLLWFFRRSKDYIQLIAHERTQDLLKSKTQMKLIFDNAGEGILGLDTEGKIIFANKMAGEILERDFDEIFGLSEHSLFHYKHPDGKKYKEADCHIISSYKKGTSSTVNDEVFWDKYGNAIQVEYTCAPMKNEDNEISGAVVVFQEITERKQMEKDLLEANAELEEFSYRVSHDLRSPLLSSIGLLKVIKNIIETKKEGDVINMLDLASKSLVKLETLVQDILTLTKAKHLEEKELAIDTGQMVKDAIEMLSHMENFDRLKINLELNCKQPIQTRKTRLKLIIDNLISNAIKYQDTSKKDSFITISTSITDGVFTFSVTDNGLGIPENQKEKMFVMFKRFHTKTSFGSGLGLYMIKKSAEYLGGEIVYKDTGDGTCFSFNLPIKE